MKLALTLSVSLLFAAPAFADSTHVCQGNSCNDSSSGAVYNNTVQGGAGGSVKNTNLNYQGQSQGQSQTQAQRQYQGQGQGQYQDVNNKQVISPSQSTSFSEPVQDRIPGLAIAPALTAAGTGVCLGSVSFGLSGPMAGVSAGWTKVDEGCETRSNAALLYNMGLRDAALRLMMTNPKVREAMLDTDAPKVSLIPSAVQTADAVAVQGQ